MPNLNLTHSGNMNITSASITSGGTLNVGYQANDTGYITGWTMTPATGDNTYETGQTISVKFYPQYSGTVLSETFVVSGVDNAGVNRSDSSVITQDYNRDLSTYFSGVVGDWYSLSTESADLISTSITSSYLEFVVQVKETATPGEALYLSISTNGSSKYTGATWLGWVKSQEPEPSSLTAITINVPSTVINSGYASASYSPSSTFVDLVYSSSDTTKATIDPTTGEITVLDSGTVQFCVTDQLSGLYDCKTVSVSTSNPRVSVTYDIITTSQPEFMMNPDAISGFTYAEYNGEEVQMGKYYTFPETGLQTIVYTLAGTVVPDEAFVYNGMQIGDHKDVVGVSFENNTTEIGRQAFERNSITSLVIPSSVTSVRQYAFNQNPLLSSITLNEGLLVIEDGAFAGSDITTVNIPSTVTGTGGYDSYKGNPFWGCHSLSSFTGTFASDDGRLLVNNGYAISFAPSGLTTYNIPSGITRVGHIFAYSNLVSVTIPSSVTRIDQTAFLGCDDLTGITIPSSVTYIGAAAFGLCSGLTSMTFESEVPATLAGESVVPPENLGPYDYTFPIYVPETAVNTYKTAWPEYAHRIVAAHTPGDQYLTFKITSPGTIRWVDRFGEYTKAIEYRKNGGSWTRITSSLLGVSIDVVSGDTLEFRGNNDYYYDDSWSPRVGAYFSSNWCTFEVEGNIMSMVYGDDFQSDDSMYTSAFTGLFSGCTGIISAENLVLPMMHLSISCYSHMFAGCRNLTKAPELPATGTGVNDYSYYAMFSGCTSLTTAPALPATTVYEGTYAYMFAGCTSLTTAPELPALVMRSNACYRSMFQNCSSLNYVKCLAKQKLTGVNNCTDNWLSGVPSGGTFVKNPEAPSNFWSRNASGIPSNWTVEDAS